MERRASAGAGFIGDPLHALVRLLLFDECLVGRQEEIWK